MCFGGSSAGRTISVRHLAHGRLFLPQPGETRRTQLGQPVEDGGAERQKKAGLDEGQECISLCWGIGFLYWNALASSSCSW